MFVQNSMAQSLVCELKQQRDRPSIADTKPLSEQEKRVLSLIAMGHSNAEIAEQLVVSTRTVETYKYRIMDKLNTKKRADLVKYAIEQGLVVK